MRRSGFIIAILIVFAACGDDKKRNGDNPDAMPDGPPGPDETVCEQLPPATTGTCDVTAGDANKLMKGIVLTPTKVFRGGQVRVDGTGQITCVGCDCAQGGETTIVCPDGAISPGLINTHDHITFTQNSPYNDTGERYEDRQQWRRGQDGHSRIDAPGGASADAIRWGELRFLMGGATSIVGSGGQPGLLRNLDSNNQEGLGQGVVEFDTFPLDDTGGTKRTGDCNYGGTPTTPADFANNDAYEPHTSEGIDGTARNEFLCQSSDSYDSAGAPQVSNNLLLAKTAMIHAIGLTPNDYGAMAAAGTALIWSPRSNITLYGDTARVTTAAKMGVEIALGTDWMPTGSMNMLRELKCADSYNTAYLGHAFSDAQLWQMVTLNAASVTATDDVIGLLAPGKVADIAVFAAHGGKTFRAVLDAEAQDVALVMRGGKVLYGDGAAVGALATGCDAVDVCGTGKQVCLMGEVGKSYTALQTGAGNIYPAFACGVPQNEPSCVPSRPAAVNGSSTYDGNPSAADMDADGIADSGDKCPGVFDPVRPLDNGAEGDADGDGAGDACDPCPVDADTTSCTVVDPNDRDHDGVPNAADNCADLANADQADADTDGKGDVCDPCPNQPNPGNAGCAVTIYSIKNGTTPVGTTVQVVNALVTGKGSNGFFVQVKEGDTGYDGPAFSGMFVFTGTGTPPLAAAVVGARVTIDGRVANFNGQIELDTVTNVVVTANNAETPAPISVTYADVKTGGARAAALEGVLLSLGASTVSAVNAQFGEFTLTAGADSLIVDDFLFLPNPAPTVGQAFTAVKGILAFRQMASKLEPRNAGDLAAGAPALQTFGPSSFARVGLTTTAPTFPTPLTVTLTGPAQGDTTVVVVSGDANALTVSDVVIPDGQTSATVSATALVPNADVTLMATLGVQTLAAHVRVLDTAEGPTAVSLAPATATAGVGETVAFTATLDVPPPADTVVDLTATAGTLPATVTVPANQVSATFDYVAAGTGTIDITATFPGGNTASAAVTIAAAAAHLLISQVYGGGGNSGAPFTNDFIELHNPGGTDASTANLSVQYASSTGTTWQVTTLPALTVPAGGFVLVQESGGATGSPLPTADATGSIPMAAGNGKVALVDGTTALSGACPTGLIDFVGYGTADCHEGASAAPALSNTTAALRASNGCSDTDMNSVDFAALAPEPRNSASSAIACN